MISITLPSLYPKALERTLKNLRDATRGPYQAIVVSPFEPPGIVASHGVLEWIEEPEGTGTGCNAGHAAAFARVDGEFVTGWVDDHYYVDGWDVLALREFVEREPSSDAPFLLGLRHVWPEHVGTQFGIYYGYFPLMRTETAHRVGWLSAEYRSGFADGDLALHVWSAGGRCEWSRSRLVFAHIDDARKNGAVFHTEDLTLFVERWGARYGAGWDTTNLRGFNLDVVPELFPEAEDNALRWNSPDFRAAALERGWRP